MLSYEELLIVMGQQITFERNQKAAAIDQTAGRDQLFVHLCSAWISLRALPNASRVWTFKYFVLQA